MKKIKLIIACLLMLAFVKTSNSQTIDEVMKNYDKAIGKEKFDKLTTLKQTGSVITAMGELTFTKYSKRPNIVRTEIEAMGQKIVQLFDGKDSYSNNPFQGINELQKGNEEQLYNAKLQADFDPPLLNYSDKGSKIELLGNEKVDSVDTYKIKLVTKDGMEDIYYVNTITFLPYRLTYKNTLNGAENNNDLRYLSYKNYNGIMIPDDIVVQQDNNPMGKELRLKVSDVELDPLVLDGMFTGDGK
ncbi:hypothetical protein BH10BAC5_BH10BAC5_07910 [soil metagenome]